MCDYSRYIAVTNRSLCRGDYLGQVEKIAACKPCALILREKDLPPQEYEALAERVLEICGRNQVPCFLHSHTEITRRLGCPNIHLSVPALREQAGRLADFQKISVSIHSLADMEEAVAKGATQLVLGNIFETDCKKGLPGKGLCFLQTVCARSPVPVYAIGGISPGNMPGVLAAGAAGGCMMSGFMRM